MKKIIKIPGDYYFKSGFVPVALRRVRGTVLTHPHDYTGIPHWHDFSELVIITSGSGVQNINGTSYPVSVGDVFVITGKTAHFFEEYQNLELVNIIFSDKVFHDIQEYLNRIPGYHLIFRLEPELRSRREFHNNLTLSAHSLSYVLGVIRKMELESGFQKPGCEAAIISALFELIVFLSRSSDSSTEKQPLPRLAGLFSLLEASYQEEWDLQRMAKCASMSVNTLLRAFQAAVNQTPLQYLTELRLKAACSLLKNTDQQIGEIAFSCGFHDSNYFSKRFRSKFHMNPTEYRAGNGNA
ncbi:MAG: helix-turn-helix domain-containing protein [Lentisphaerae bacterium]|nr:helix-turn-helix domain-containing protein [Lentisphaerota bacterium]